MKKKVIFIILSGFIFLRVYAAQTTTFIVNTTDDTVDLNPGDGIASDAFGNCSLRAAIMEANALPGRDTIVLPEGVFFLTLKSTQEDKSLDGDLDVVSNMTIQGAGRDLTIIDGNQVDRVFHIKGKVTVSILDLTIRNGKTKDGGVSPSPGPGGCGGGILIRFADVTIENSSITNNETGKGGVDKMEREDIYEGSLDGGYGGGIYNKEGSVSVKDSDISHNRTGRGGSWYGSYGASGGDGGGIYNCKGSVITLEKCTICKNQTGDYGPGGWEDGNGGCGGGICNSGELTVTACTIKDNTCGDGGFEGGGGWGGGIENNYPASAEISMSLIDGNVTGDSQDMPGGSGGGISNGGYLTLRNCTLSNNRTMRGSFGGEGGGIYNCGDVTIKNCTISHNACFMWGAGIYNEPWDYPIPSILNIKNTIVANNSVHSSLYPSKTYPDDCWGTIVSLGYILIGTAERYTIAGDETGNIYGINPLLGVLADNGGPTMTYSLLPASPAIDAGHPTEFENTDQRGVSRPKDGDGDGEARSDIGAFELFSPTVIITEPGTGDGVSGMISIAADANTEYVDFYIDNMLLCESKTPPFICEWDTLLYPNGSHKIEAKAYDVKDSWLSAQNHVNVLVDNSTIDLNVSRIEDRAWIIRREYGRVAHAGCIAVSKYIIERKEEGGTYNTVAEINESELSGNSYTYNDPLPGDNVSYTYRVRAVSGTNMTVGLSDEAAI